MTDKELHLRYAEAYFLMDKESYLIPGHLIAEGTFERRMWLELFKWAGWKEK